MNTSGQHQANSPTCRSRRLWARTLASILAACVGLMPVGPALAEQVLEVPSAATSPTSASAGMANPKPPPRATHRVAPPRPSDLGSLSDYERETGSDSAGNPSPGYSSGYGPSYASIPMSPGAGFEMNLNGNRQSLAQNALFGALIIGLLAMQLNDAQQPHHHHHHHNSYWSE